MKKLIISLAFVALSSVAAKAIEMPVIFGNMSLTGGIAANQAVFGATAKQDEYNAAGTAIDASNEQSGVFTDGYGSQFIEIGFGQYISFGFEHVPDAISTPTTINESSDGNPGNTSNVSVDFNDFNTYYAKINTPWGIYLKAGTVETDLDIKETQLSGNTYKNVSTSGTTFGGGYEKFIGGSNFSIRAEGNYMELDTVNTENSVALTGGTTTNGGHAKVKGSNMEGLTGKIALTYTFGRN